jgi:hypothetical protein
MTERVPRARGVLAAWAGFAGAHVAWVALYLGYSAWRTGGRYLGTSLERVPNLITVLLGHYAWRAVLPALVVALAVAPFVAAASARLPQGRPARLGALAYAGWTLLLLAMAPGAFVRLPGFAALPIGVGMAIAVVGSAVVAIAPMWRTPRAALPWLVGLSIPLWFPHDGVRAVRAALTGPARAAGAPGALLLVVDALRLDTFCAAAPGPWRATTLRGSTHFGSTRKQYRLLATGNAGAVAPWLFIPTADELAATPPDSLLGPRLARAGRRLAFLIDDALTASAATIGDRPRTYAAPSDGIQDALLAGTWTVPLASWLWNVAGPIEGINPWSDRAAWRRDVARAVRQHEAVIAHTVWLQHPPYALEELRAVGGRDWWRRRARSYEVRLERAPPGDTLFPDARAVYEQRVATLMAEFAAWPLLRDTTLAIVVTSDHGQAFPEGPIPGRHYGGLHGWDLSPATTWIPVLPLGRTRPQVTGAATLTWLALRRWLLQDGAAGAPLAGDTAAVALTLPLIVAHQLQPAGAVVPDDVLTPARIVEAVSLDWERGWMLPPSFVARGWRTVGGTARGTVLEAPASLTALGEARPATAWIGYEPVADAARLAAARTAGVAGACTAP